MAAKLKEPITTAGLKRLADNLDKKLQGGPCDRAPKRCFDPDQRGKDKGYSDWDPKAMCDSCAAAWHAGQLVLVMTRKILSERQQQAGKGATS